MSRVLLPLLIFALLLSAVALPQNLARAQSTFIAWEQRYDGGAYDAALAVAADSNDNVIVTGCSEIQHDYPVANETVGTGNGSQTNFTLGHHPIVNGSERIYLGGNQTTNYTIDYTTGKITFNTAPGIGVAITADYDYEVVNYDYYTIKYNSRGNELWNRTYDSGGSDEAHGIAVDLADNIIVTGYCQLNYYTIKYTPNGTELWNSTYNSGGDDLAFAAAVDSESNITVTGRSNDNYYTIKYDPNGTELWNRTYNGTGFDEATGVAVDSDDNIVVTGYSMNATGNSTNDYYTIKYDPNGNEIWNVTYDSGGNDCAQEVALDSEGNIAVTGGSIALGGNSTWYYCTVKYYPNGTEFWTEPVTYHSPYTYTSPGEDVGTGDGSTTEFMLGYHPVVAGSEKIYLNYVLTTNYTINYTAGQITFNPAPGSGKAITATYRALAGATAFGAAVDSEDNIIVTGRSYYLPWSAYAQPNIVIHPEISNCYYTVKYSPDGNEIWGKTYDRLYQECAYSVARDSDDSIIVTGKVSDGKTWNYFTIKYAESSSEGARGVSPWAIAVIAIMAGAAIGGTGYYFFLRRKKAA